MNVGKNQETLSEGAKVLDTVVSAGYYYVSRRATLQHSTVHLLAGAAGKRRGGPRLSVCVL